MVPEEMGAIRSVLVFGVVVAAIAGGAWYAFTSVSYGPLEERVGQVVRAEHVPEHEEQEFEEDEQGREENVLGKRGRSVRRTVPASWLVIVAWEHGEHESRSRELFSQVRVGSEVTLHVRQRLWRSKPSGWSVQSVSPR